MERFTTKAIILDRTNYGEADRIITFLTPAHGKQRAIAKGVRKSRSKLAGALEIFSVSQILLLPGKKEIGTVMSAKLDKHFGNVVKDIKSTETAYEYMRLINKTTPERPEAAFFELLTKAFECLDQQIEPEACQLWFKLQLLKLSGHSPNLRQNTAGQKLALAQTYDFDYEKMRYQPGRGKYKTEDIKFMRLAMAAATPAVLEKIAGLPKLVQANLPMVNTMLSAHLNL